MTICPADVVQITVTQEMIDEADQLSRDHMQADAHETPVFQTDEYKNKMVGYLGQIAFRNYRAEIGSPCEFSQVNMDGSPDLCDFEIDGKKIDVKTFTWGSYWANAVHRTWSEETGSIRTLEDLVNKFYFLIFQIQLNIDDSHNTGYNRRKKTTPPKDIYWALFLRSINEGYEGATVYIVGWCTYQDILDANERQQFFRFADRFPTNIAVPLRDMNTNTTRF